jgi:integrase/recombinase XerD
MKLTEVFEQYIIDLENRGRAQGTIGIRRRVVDGLLIRWLSERAVTDIEQVTLPLLRQFVNYLINSDSEKRFPGASIKGRLAPSTIDGYVTIVKTFFNWCVDEELLSASPARRVQGPKVPEKVTKTFADDQLARLFGVCDAETKLGFRNYVIVVLLLDTGMRVSELVGLRLSDVKPRYVMVHGKGQKEREIGLHPEAGKLLWKYIAKFRTVPGVESDYVFLGGRGPLTVSGVEQLFLKLKKDAGIEDVRVSPHTLRHTFSKRYLENGGELFKLSRELGHSDVQITANKYLGDFKSTEARQDHDARSPLSNVKLKMNANRKGGKGKRK